MEKLIKAYTNEKSTKALLKYDSIVDDFNSILSEKIIKLQENDQHSLTQTLSELEIEMVTYYIKEYILCRFDKIRNNFYVDSNLLSFKEKVFYEKYLEYMTENNIIHQEEIAKSPEFVGFIANKNIETIKIDKEILKILQGEFFIANLEDIIEYVNGGSVYLC